MNDKLTTAGTLTSSLTGVFGFLTFQQWLGLFGAVMTLLSVGMAFYFKRRDDRRREALFKMELAKAAYAAGQREAGEP